MTDTLLHQRRSAGRVARRRFAPSLEKLEDRTLLSVASSFDPATRTWYLHSENAKGAADVGVFQFGSKGTIAVAGDWDGDTNTGIGTFDPQTATWNLRNEASNGPANFSFVFGTKGMIPLVGDWDGDGADGIGGFDPKTKTWIFRNSLSAGPADITFQWGKSRFLPVVGDWDGDGTIGIGGYDPKNGKWRLHNDLTADSVDATFRYGGAGLVPLAGNWDETGGDGIGVYNPKTASFQLRNDASAGSADIVFRFGEANGQPIVGNFVAPSTSNPNAPTMPATEILSLTLAPIDLNLLGLQVQTSEIQVHITAQPGSGKLLGNLLTTVANLINLETANNALNQVLDSVVGLVNSVDLSVTGVETGSGPLSSSEQTSSLTVLDLYVAPIHLDLLGAVVDTSEIKVTITAHPGQGNVLGNVVVALANLFNPPLPDQLDLDFINTRLEELLQQLNVAAPGIGRAPVATTPPADGAQRVLSLTLAPIDLDLLGLILRTSQIQVNVDASTGDGLLLGNVLTTLLNTLGATPENLDRLNNNLNALLAKVIGILNNADLILPLDALSSLATVLQTLALPNLVTSDATASTKILDLIIASSDGTTPPVDVDLLGLRITTSNIEAELLAETGEGNVLGNLLYNLAHLLDPGGSTNLLTILSLLGL